MAKTVLKLEGNDLRNERIASKILGMVHKQSHAFQTLH